MTYHSSFSAFFDAAFFLLFAIVVTSVIDTADNTLKWLSRGKSLF